MGKKKVLSSMYVCISTNILYKCSCQMFSYFSFWVNKESLNPYFPLYKCIEQFLKLEFQKHI